MRIGVPTETKPDEYRVALTPAGVRELVGPGHEVVVQSGAGLGSAIEDGDYAVQGATLVASADEVFGEAELILKVKEPQPQEVERLRPDHTLFTYLHLAADAALTTGLMASGATCIAYETVEGPGGQLPLLAPMSEIAGRIATQAGATMLEKPNGGRGMLLGGAPGVPPARVVVIGAGVVGSNAARMALGLGATVTLLDKNIARLRELELLLGGACSTVYSSTLSIEEQISQADLVIGAVLVPGGVAPTVVSRDQLELMKANAVLVDVAIDQGGCFETSHATTHSAPSYAVAGIQHYCVANMPGAVPITSTYALTNATLPYVLKLAGGVAGALASDPGFAAGLNVEHGELRNEPVARAHGLEWRPAAAARVASGVAS